MLDKNKQHKISLYNAKIQKETSNIATIIFEEEYQDKYCVLWIKEKKREIGHVLFMFDKLWHVSGHDIINGCHYNKYQVVNLEK